LGSLESVELQDSDGDGSAAGPGSARPERQASREYDLKLNAKMLPMDRIRPTIGMNLAKVEICGAKCHVSDVGGRIQSLWERYYDDCDAVIFVWKLEDEDHDDERNNNNQNDEDSEVERPTLTPEMQRLLLEQVRSAIPDDVPFLVLGHLFHPVPRCQTDVLYSTAPLLPHYHNPCQALYFGNARTGQGVRTAVEWLIPLAKRQQRLRERHPVTIEK
jgi:ADP-ribosylation factor family